MGHAHIQAQAGHRPGTGVGLALVLGVGLVLAIGQDPRPEATHPRVQRRRGVAKAPGGMRMRRLLSGSALCGARGKHAHFSASRTAGAVPLLVRRGKSPQCLHCNWICASDL